MGYIMSKQSLEKNSNGTIKPIIGRVKNVHTFENGINTKVSEKAGVKFEHAYYNVAR